MNNDCNRVELVVVRVGGYRNAPCLKISKPCRDCAAVIRANAFISTVVYSTESGALIREDARHLVSAHASGGR